MGQDPAAGRQGGHAGTNLFGLTPAEIEELFLASGHARFHARQLAQWMYRRRAGNFESMTDLSRSLRAELSTRFRIARPEVVQRHDSPGGEAAKYLFELEDGRRIESVLLRNKQRHTICISSQAGCALACTFCATGRIGLLRDLTPGEIAGQIAEIGPVLPLEAPAFNIVFMGMGEPLDNYDNVLKAIRLLADPESFNISTRRITVSTSGFVPQIRMLAGEGLHVGLAISLNATTDRLRSELMPINRRYPIRTLVEAARHYAERTGRRVTIEYVLLAGLNDSPEDAARLAKIARSLPAKVNLLRFNPFEGAPYSSPVPEAIDAFARLLLPSAPAVTVRQSRGEDIMAACGQLVAGQPMRPLRRRGADIA
jgi:23S rRNA (adenine2503-C2)-methyltransferase